MHPLTNNLSIPNTKVGSKEVKFRQVSLYFYPILYISCILLGTVFIYEGINYKTW